MFIETIAHHNKVTGGSPLISCPPLSKINILSKNLLEEGIFDLNDVLVANYKLLLLALNLLRYAG